MSVREDLVTLGVAVIEDAFDWQKISGLLDNARLHAQRIMKDPDVEFPPSHRWVRSGLACDLTVLDPGTTDKEADDFNQTTLHAAIMTDDICGLLTSEIGDDLGYAWVRARLVLPRAENNGAIDLHQEKTAVRFPGLRVLWTPLTPPNVVTNREAPGIQFLVNGRLFRPELKCGDVAIFTGEIEHGTHIPEKATDWRVGCDIRVFVWTEDNLLPAAAIAMGERPRRLKVRRLRE